MGLRRFHILALVILVGLAFSIYPQDVPVPDVKVSLDRPAGSLYTVSSRFRVYLELNMPAYVRLYAVRLDGKKELLYPKRPVKSKLGPGKVSLGVFGTSLTGLVYLQVFAYTDQRYLDTFSKLENAGALKPSKMVFPHGADVVYFFNVVKKSFGRLKVLGSGYVTVDDQLEFKAPKEIFLPVGEHTVSYKVENRKIAKRIRIGKNELVQVKLPSASVQVKTYRISVQSNPSNADVYVDGEFSGRTPTIITLKEGFHAIRIEKTGYETYEIVREVNKDMQLNVSLKRAKGIAVFDSNPRGARVFLNGKEIGTTPVELQLYQGCYNVAYIKRGYRTFVFDACIFEEKEVFSFAMVRIE